MALAMDNNKKKHLNFKNYEKNNSIFSNFPYFK